MKQLMKLQYVLLGTESQLGIKSGGIGVSVCLKEAGARQTPVDCENVVQVWHCPNGICLFTVSIQTVKMN